MTRKDEELVKAMRKYAENAQNNSEFDPMRDFDEAADALEAAYARMAELEEAQRWIPVGERLPRSNTPVQVYMPKLYMSVQTGLYDRYYGEDDDEWYEHWVAPSEVTHWKALPKPPEEEK